jgi:ribosome-binding factor A
METIRQNKISRLIQKELSEVFREQTTALPGTMVTVSMVRVSPDLRNRSGTFAHARADYGKRLC